MSSFMPGNIGVREGCICGPSLLTIHELGIGLSFGTSVGNTKVTNLVFADDIVILSELLEVLLMAFEAMHKEVKPLGLEVSCAKTKGHVFRGLVDETARP